MRKPLYNIVIFIFHIITLILLFTLCIHFNVIKLDLSDFSKEAVASFFKNDYVVNIVCTILTAAALYIIQIKYSKHKLKSDFRCNEIIHDVYDGIERTHELIKESKELSNEIEELEKDPNMDFNVYRKEEALKYLAFYKKHKGDFKICNIALTYPNNWILIDSVQTVFFINLNFKLWLGVILIPVCQPIPKGHLRTNLLRLQPAALRLELLELLNALLLGFGENIFRFGVAVIIVANDDTSLPPTVLALSYGSVPGFSFSCHGFNSFPKISSMKPPTIPQACFCISVVTWV